MYNSCIKWPQYLLVIIPRFEVEHYTSRKLSSNTNTEVYKYMFILINILSKMKR